MKKTTKSNIALLLGIVFISWAFMFGSGTAMAASEPDVLVYSADVGDDYVLLEGEIDSDGGDDIYEYGFYYGTDEDDPTDIRIEVGEDISEGESFTYELDVDDLDEDSTYYFVAYARNSEGRGYSSTREFTTESGSSSDDVPEVTTDDVDVGDDSATVYGTLDDDGGDDITEYGFYYGESRSDMTKVRTGYDIDEGDDFEEDLDDLDEDTTYYYKAYAKNSEGTGYGDIESFTTGEDSDDDDSDSSKPEVTTKTPKFYGDYATLYGIVDDQGDSSIREYGFYWGEDSDCDEKLEVGGSDLDEDETFSVNVDDLSSSKTYYVKAYARNSSGTSYGDVESFGGGSLAKVSARVVDSGSAGITLTGTVDNNGGSTITEYGFYWSPVGGAQTQVRFTGNVGQNVPFAYFLSGQPAGQYTFKAYAVTVAGTAYSSEVSFTGAGGSSTVSPTVPAVPSGSAPVVLISSPVAGMTITRGQVIEIGANSTDDVRVDAMGLYINGDKKMRCGGSNFQYYWNTSGLAAGTYNIRVTSWDGAQVGEKTVTVYVR